MNMFYRLPRHLARALARALARLQRFTDARRADAHETEGAKVGHDNLLTFPLRNLRGTGVCCGTTSIRTPEDARG